jgi:hypothetical protein
MRCALPATLRNSSAVREDHLAQYGTLPTTLADKSVALGQEVTLGRRRLGSFDEIEAEGSKSMALRFDDAGTVLARELILAMPRGSLEVLEQTGVSGDNQDGGPYCLIQECSRTCRALPHQNALGATSSARC